MRFRLRTLLIVLAASAGARPTLLAAADDAPMVRQDMAARLAKVRVGYSPDTVKFLAGPPDKRLQKDTDTSMEYAEAKEVWYYGVAGDNSFPTLGRVYFRAPKEGGTDLTVFQVFGQGRVSPAVSELPEDKVRRVLATLGKENLCQYRYFDSAQTIAAVNALHSLGKEQAVALIDEYLRVCPEDHGYNAEKIWMILLLLFEPSERHMTPMLGQVVPDPPDVLRSRPTFPLLVQEGIPLLMVHGYSLSGAPPTVLPAVRFYEAHGTLRKAPLKPNPKPWTALDKFADAKVGAALTGNLADRNRLRVQLLTLLRPVLAEVKLDYAKCSDGVELRGDPEWNGIVDKLKALQLEWVDERGSYAVVKHREGR